MVVVVVLVVRALVRSRDFDRYCDLDLDRIFNQPPRVAAAVTVGEEVEATDTASDKGANDHDHDHDHDHDQAAPPLQRAARSEAQRAVVSSTSHRDSR